MGPSCYPLSSNTMRQSIVLFGEVHGTREVPALLFSLIRALLGRQKSVMLMLEMPREEREFIRGLLQSSHEECDKLFWRSPFWQKTYPFGQASVAFLDLLIGLRRLNKKNGRVAVEPIAPSSDGANDYVMSLEHFEEGLFQNMAELVNTSGKEFDFIFVVAGSNHARYHSHAIGEVRVASFGERVVAAYPHAINLLLSPEGGTSWCWIQDPESFNQGEYGFVGPQAVGLTTMKRVAAYSVTPGSSGWCYEGNIGKVEASPPAKFENFQKRLEEWRETEAPEALLKEILSTVAQLSIS